MAARDYPTVSRNCDRWEATRNLVIVGIDPGLADTGYAVVRDRGSSQAVAVVEAGLIRTDVGQPLESRLATLYGALSDLFSSCRPGAVAVEGLYSTFEYPHTAILMGHARGIVLLAAAQCGAKVYDYPPARVKRALTGNGAAQKRQVQRMVQYLLGLSQLPEPDHVADALALAICHHRLTAREGIS